jgi:hypothetical protein
MNTGLEERIRDRAYEIWNFEGRPDGRDREHWSQATKELTKAVACSTGIAKRRSQKSHSKRQPRGRRTPK